MWGNLIFGTKFKDGQRPNTCGINIRHQQNACDIMGPSSLFEEYGCSSVMFEEYLSFLCNVTPEGLMSITKRLSLSKQVVIDRPRSTFLG